MDDSVKVVVDARDESTFEIEADAASALDVFHHPFAYAAYRDCEIVDTEPAMQRV